MSNEHNLGPQPISQFLEKHGLAATDLVRASKEQLTYKMVSRAVKGRRLTANTMRKVVRALNQASASAHTQAELFNYTPSKGTPREEQA